LLGPFSKETGMMWPIAHASRKGLVEFVFGAIFFPAGVLLLQQAGVRSPEGVAATRPFALAGMLLLVAVGVVVFRIVRRREYPWLLALAAIALPFFDPTQAPYHGGFRVVVGVRDLVLIGVTAIFIAQSIRRADELERKIHLEALAWSYTIGIVLLLVYAMAADVLPPLRGSWVASGLLAAWVLSWLATSVWYQR
jgi:hypothetical protein